MKVHRGEIYSFDRADYPSNPFFWVVFLGVVITGVFFTDEIVTFLDGGDEALMGFYRSTMRNIENIMGAPSQPTCLETIFALIALVLLLFFYLIVGVILGILILIASVVVTVVTELQRFYILPVVIAWPFAYFTHLHVERFFWVCLTFVTKLLADLIPRRWRGGDGRTGGVIAMKNDKDKKTAIQRVGNSSPTLSVSLPKPAPDGLLSSYIAKAKLKADIEYYHKVEQALAAQEGVVQAGTRLQDALAEHEDISARTSRRRAAEAADHDHKMKAHTDRMDEYRVNQARRDAEVAELNIRKMEAEIKAQKLRAKMQKQTDVLEDEIDEIFSGLGNIDALQRALDKIDAAKNIPDEYKDTLKDQVLRQHMKYREEQP